MVLGENGIERHGTTLRSKNKHAGSAHVINRILKIATMERNNFNLCSEDVRAISTLPRLALASSHLK